MKLVDLDYINEKEKALVNEFITSTETKKYILGINKFSRCVQKLIEVDGIIDDFTRVQSSRKKSVLKIEDVPQDALILNTASGSPLEVIEKLDLWGFKHVNYLSLYRYSFLDLLDPPFMSDFRMDFLQNKKEYEKTYHLLADKKSKEVFTKVINFKKSFDFEFMKGFTNNHEEQYFDKALIPSIKNMCFVDGGAYVGDTLPYIIKNFPDFKKIYAIEPNTKHMQIAKRDFETYENIEFINCGLGKEKQDLEENSKEQHHGEHDYQAQNINTIDNLIKDNVDYIKLDIEGAEQDALLGATETIKKYKPILAVCIYHKAEDWYKVPQIIQDIDSEYTFYLRHYMEGIYETVLYAIPKRFL